MSHTTPTPAVTSDIVRDGVEYQSGHLNSHFIGFAKHNALTHLGRVSVDELFFPTDTVITKHALPICISLMNDRFLNRITKDDGKGGIVISHYSHHADLDREPVMPSVVKLATYGGREYDLLIGRFFDGVKLVVNHLYRTGYYKANYLNELMNDDGFSEDNFLAHFMSMADSSFEMFLRAIVDGLENMSVNGVPNPTFWKIAVQMGYTFWDLINTAFWVLQSLDALTTLPLDEPSDPFVADDWLITLYRRYLNARDKLHNSLYNP